MTLSKIKFLTLPVLFAFVVVSPGCQNCASQMSNPFAQSAKTVPPPATFFSQESYLGQTPGNYIPQTPAVVFPSSDSLAPTQPIPAPPATPLSEATNNTGDGATLFAASEFATSENTTDWTPIDVATTSHTAFQAMEAKANAAVSTNFESLVVGASHFVTTITDESDTPLTEPQQLLYSGGYE